MTPEGLMTPDEIATVGEALWGQHWRAEMACALGVAQRTLERWLSGYSIPPSGVALDLQNVAIDRQEAARRVVAMLQPARLQAVADAILPSS